MNRTISLQSLKNLEWNDIAVKMRCICRVIRETYLWIKDQILSYFPDNKMLTRLSLRQLYNSILESHKPFFGPVTFLP